MKKFEEVYVAIWCTLMPITGTMILPSVQGTIPAYMMAFGSVFFVFLRLRAGEVPPHVQRYGKTFLIFALLWLFLLVGSQIGLMISDRHDFGSASMIDPNDSSILFRLSLFTQSLYLLACVLIALYFNYFFQERWMRYVYWGGYLLASYGIYEWLYYLIFQQPGDFLVNRSFGDHPASWSQGVAFGGINLLRIKSTLGEPTFFAAVVIPYLFMALDANKKILAGMLLFTAVFSTSTACYLTLPTVLVLKSLWTGKIRWDYLGVLAIFGLFLFGLATLFPDNFRSIFADKFNGDNDSGSSRINAGMDTQSLLDSFTIPNRLFGIGFGYAYFSIYYELYANTGYIGLGAFLWVFLRVAWLLPLTKGCEGLKAGLIAILILCDLSLSELFLPPTWMFVGLAYFKLEQYRRRQAVASTRAAIASPSLIPSPPGLGAPGMNRAHP